MSAEDTQKSQRIFQRLNGTVSLHFILGVHCPEAGLICIYVYSCIREHILATQALKYTPIGNGDKTDYYRYMDTSMSALAPFKPELIEELVVVRAHSTTQHNADLDLPTRALLAVSSTLS
jgi:hypothetical protein